MSTEEIAVPLSATPATGQLVEHENKTYETIREGRAYILIPPNTRTSLDPKLKSKADNGKDVVQSVFYNPIQQFNRDLSVLAIKAFGEDLCAKRNAEHEHGSGKRQARKERKQKNRTEAKGAAGQKEVGATLGGTAEAQTEIANEGDGYDQAQPDSDGLYMHTAESGQARQHPVPEAPMLSAAKRKAETQDELDGEADRAVKQRKVGESPCPDLDDHTGTTYSQQGTALESSETGIEAQNGDANGERGSDDVQQAAAPAIADGDENGSKLTAETSTTDSSKPPPPWRPRFRILDALSATGLRALRYASEIPFATTVVANDMDRGAVKSIRLHVEHNKLGGRIIASHNNAIGHMYGAAYPPPESHGPSHINGRYDVIDLDPYGTAAPFIDAALQALNDGGLLCVTCTDSGVFASCGYAEKTYSLYGGMPIKGPHSHEGGLRLIINSVATTAAKYGLAIEPLLSLSIDFYARVFIRITKSPADVKFLAGKTMLVYDCDTGCGAWHTQMLGRNTRQTGKGPSTNPTFNFKHGIAQAPNVDRSCEHCGSRMHIAGPMWAGPLHNAGFVQKVLSDAQAADKRVYHTTARLEGMLDTALNELSLASQAGNEYSADGTITSSPKTPPETLDSHPFFFIPSALAKVIHCIAPPEAAVKGALRHAGYRATRSHCKPGSIKTDAPWSVVWEIMREWVRQKQPIKEGALKEGYAGWNIMQKARKAEEEDSSVSAEEDASEANAETAETAEDDSTTQTGPAKADSTKPARLKVVFDEVLGKDKPGKKMVRYQANPRENWGPMSRAKGSA